MYIHGNIRMYTPCTGFKKVFEQLHNTKKYSLCRHSYNVVFLISQKQMQGVNCTLIFLIHVAPNVRAKYTLLDVFFTKRN